MKVVVTGATGQLGFDVCAELTKLGHAVISASRPAFDLSVADSASRFILSAQPEGVIHCAAYTAVDRAEDEPDLCARINAAGTREVALACRDCGAKMIYISTDYVFGGEGTAPHDTSEPPAPLNVYGRTKYEGELAVRELLSRCFIVRTSWVFGRHGKNFVSTMLRLGQTHDELRVVDDQWGAPTYTVDLAPLLCKMLESENYGTYHAANEGVCTWAQFAAEIFALAGMRTRVQPIPASAYPAKARRPYNSRLDMSSLDRADFSRLPHWRNALKRFIAPELGPVTPTDAPEKTHPASAEN